MNGVSGWMETDGSLVRAFRFRDFAEAFAFLTRVALHAEKVNHHPDFCCRWSTVEFRLTSHDKGEVTSRDIALAESINRLAEQSAEIGGSTAGHSTRLS